MALSNLKLVAGVVGGCNLVGYGLTALFETHKLTDLIGTGSFVVATYCLTRKNHLFEGLNQPANWRLKAINLGVMLWGTRLALYLFSRVLKLGHDERLNKFFRKPGESYFDKSASNFPIRLSYFWIIQSMWGFLLLLPVTFLNSVPLGTPSLTQAVSSASLPLKILTLIPTLGMFGGIIIEAIADNQKSVYRGNPKNNGHWCDVGLYSLARYPNYFAELLFWWSVYFYCAPSLSWSLRLVSLISPLFSSFIILKLSGVPLLEKKNKLTYGSDPKYQSYVENTNMLVPIPKLFGNGVQKSKSDKDL